MSYLRTKTILSSFLLAVFTLLANSCSKSNEPVELFISGLHLIIPPGYVLLYAIDPASRNPKATSKIIINLRLSDFRPAKTDMLPNDTLVFLRANDRAFVGEKLLRQLQIYPDNRHNLQRIGSYIELPTISKDLPFLQLFASSAQENPEFFTCDKQLNRFAPQKLRCQVRESLEGAESSQSLTLAYSFPMSDASKVVEIDRGIKMLLKTWTASDIRGSSRE